MAEWNWFTPITSTREGYGSVDEKIEVLTTSAREGHAGVGEVLGYGEFFHDRTGYASVVEAIAVSATSTREGHAGVGVLLGYGEFFHDRTGYADVETAVTYRRPDFDEVSLVSMGWGVPMQPDQVLIVYRGAAEGLAQVSEYVGVVLAPLNNREATGSVSSYVVAPL